MSPAEPRPAPATLAAVRRPVARVLAPLPAKAATTAPALPWGAVLLALPLGTMLFGCAAPEPRMKGFRSQHCLLGIQEKISEVNYGVVLICDDPEPVREKDL